VVRSNGHGEKPHFILGLDLGQVNDYTAFVVTERVLKKVGAPYSARGWRNTPSGAKKLPELRQNVENIIHVRYMERVPLRTSYEKVVDGVISRIRALCPPDKYPLGGEVVLVVDGTGVGRAVIDMFANAVADFHPKKDPVVGLWPVTVTGGTGRAKADGPWITLPKTELIFTGGVVPLQSGRLKWGPDVPFRKPLEEELRSYRRTVNINTASMQFEPWREAENDDLLFALTLCGWAWKRFALKYTRTEEDFVPELVPAPAGRTPILGSPLPPLP
jgi:hypothetical protein